jgi:hypothetical protein
VNGPVRSVEVESVEWQVGDDPFGNLAHVFVFDDEIAGPRHRARTKMRPLVRARRRHADRASARSRVECCASARLTKIRRLAVWRRNTRSLSVITQFDGLMFTLRDGQGGKDLQQNGTGIATGAVLAMSD